MVGWIWPAHSQQSCHKVQREERQPACSFEGQRRELSRAERRERAACVPWGWCSVLVCTDTGGPRSLDATSWLQPRGQKEFESSLKKFTLCYTTSSTLHSVMTPSSLPRVLLTILIIPSTSSSPGFSSPLGSLKNVVPAEENEQHVMVRIN